MFDNVLKTARDRYRYPKIDIWVCDNQLHAGPRPLKEPMTYEEKEQVIFDGLKISQHKTS
jgi:hypothetical protein